MFKATFGFIPIYPHIMGMEVLDLELDWTISDQIKFDKYPEFVPNEISYA